MIVAGSAIGNVWSIIAVPAAMPVVAVSALDATQSVDRFVPRTERLTTLLVNVIQEPSILFICHFLVKNRFRGASSWKQSKPFIGSCQAPRGAAAPREALV